MQPSLKAEITRLKLRHTWTTVMSSSDFRDTLQLGYSRDGLTGHGEGAPSSATTNRPNPRRKLSKTCGRFFSHPTPASSPKFSPKSFIASKASTPPKRPSTSL
jgi:hypothetical protein